VSLSNARKSARDAKRIADVRQIQTALELYYNNTGSYPLTGEIDNSIATGSNTYMAVTPTAPTPADGCSDEDNEYTYTSSDGSSYTIEFCISSGIGELSGGLKVAIPGGITNPAPWVWTCGVDNLIDSRDSTSYPTVKIGTQCWMAKNLNIGTMIEGSSEQSSNSSIEKYCYNDDPNNCNIYGGLYQWNEMMQYTTSEPNQGICPSGWHIPSHAEWTTLTNYLSADSGYWCGPTSTQIAKSLANTSYWTSTTTVCAPGNDLDSNNITGFSALPAGRRSDGSFDSIGNDIFIWSSSFNGSYGRYRGLSHSYAKVFNGLYLFTCGFSVRCLQD
jgi:uncharacterized protein (TIGR02145 family)